MTGGLELPFSSPNGETGVIGCPNVGPKDDLVSIFSKNLQGDGITYGFSIAYPSTEEIDLPSRVLRVRRNVEDPLVLKV
jgi:hypothetical protein